MSRARVVYSQGDVLHHECPACGGLYIPERKDKVYCDRACKQHGFRERRKFRVGNVPDPLDHHRDPSVPRET